MWKHYNSMIPIYNPLSFVPLLCILVLYMLRPKIHYSYFVLMVSCLIWVFVFIQLMQSFIKY
jgi:hypothetical protein